MPDVEPAGVDGVDGGLLILWVDEPVMVTGNGFDQLEAFPLSSVALDLTLKVLVDPEATVQVCDALADAPELTRDVADVVPSPQSKAYLTRSPSGSIAFVE